MKKELYIPLIIFSLTMFIAFNLLVFVAKGQEVSNCNNNTKWDSDPYFLGVNLYINHAQCSDIPIPSKYLENFTKDSKINGYGMSFGLSYLFFVDYYPHSNYAFVFNGDYNRYCGSMTKLIGSLPTIINNKMELNNVSFNEEYNNSTISVDALFRYYFLPKKFNLSISAGFGFDYLLSSKLSQKVTSTFAGIVLSDSVPNLKYENDGKTIVLYDDKPKNMNNLICSWKAEITEEAFYKNFIYSFTFGYNCNITKITQNLRWDLSDFYMGIRVYCDIK